MTEAVEYISSLAYWDNQIVKVSHSTFYRTIFKNIVEGVERDKLFSFVGYLSETVSEAITLAYLAGYSAKSRLPVFPSRVSEGGRPRLLSELVPLTETRAWDDWKEVIKTVAEESKLTRIRLMTKRFSHHAESLREVSNIAYDVDEAIVLAFYAGMSYALVYYERMMERGEI